MPTQAEAEVTQSAGTLQLLVFDVAGEEYALKLTETREIIRTPEVTSVPNTPDYVTGVANLRGQVLTIIDLKTMFHLEGSEKEGSEALKGSTSQASLSKLHTIVVEHEGELYGLQVDLAKEVLRIEEGNLKQTPDVLESHAQSHYLKGVIVIEGEKVSRIILALNLSQVLNETSLSQLNHGVQPQ